MSFIQIEAGFLDRPHDRLYPAIWAEDEQMRPEARTVLSDAIRSLLFDALGASAPDVRLAVIGSGASYNWSEAGDLDVQVWVADESILAQVRRLIVANLMGRTCADYGLATADCAGAMEVQYFAKPGRGTPEDNLSGQPYACYDMDLDRWLAPPYPLTPEMYGDLFELVYERAEVVAVEAERLLAAYDRARADADYWLALSEQAPEFAPTAKQATERVQLAHADVKALYQQVAGARSDAYTADGKGIKDERDAMWKLLEVWNINPRLKNVAQGKP